MENNNYLVHHGVLGQKWGVRNDDIYRNGALGRRVRAARMGLLVPKDDVTNSASQEKVKAPYTNEYNGVLHRRMAARRALQSSDVSDIIKRHLNDKI